MRYVYKLRKVCIKSNGHSVTSALIICLPQLTIKPGTNTQIVREGTQASDRDLDPDPDQNGVAV